MSADLLCGSETTNNKTAGQLCERMQLAWDSAYKQMKKVVALQAKYYNKQHKFVAFELRDFAFLNIVNLGLKNTSGKLQTRFPGPFGIIDKKKDTEL